MFPIHEIPTLDELRRKVAELRAPFEPEQMHAFLNLLKTSAIVTRALDEFFARFHLSLARFSILAMLYFRYQEGQTSTEMAAKRAVSKATLTAVLDSLARDKLIVRLPDPKDRRRRVIRLTTVGFAKMEDLVPHYQEFLKHVIGELDLKQLPVFLQVLETFQTFGPAVETAKLHKRSRGGQTPK